MGAHLFIILTKILNDNSMKALAIAYVFSL
ncbi:hypothetical protein PTD2_18695 [Pseudoalteromonas tunicata D2]|uniref:Uncharacterized protein n=1 Tax=Pseudoalteromonas tunicata D2 TaxID=87626 RepID=A4CBZ2_9GAMM|nr:hypothetical protein PTD2_18695 [Pseudoalteromonas tunicata D2]